MTVKVLRPALRLVGGLVVGTALLVAVELRVAGMWPRLPPPDFDLDGPVGADDGRRRLRLVWLGDSTVAGEGASDAAHTLPHLVARGLDRPVEIRALAEPATTVGEVVREQAPRVAGLSPDVVFVSVGANDVSHLHTRGRFSRRYRDLVRALPGGVPLVLVGIPDMGAAIPRRVQPMRAFSEWRGFRLDAAVRRVAGESGATYVNIAGRTGRLFRRHRDRLYAADRYHPGDEGYRVWARAVLDRLREAGVPAAS
ncbi:MAG: SGNH/GDSL hydrolase family protein [Actinomycetota bacterium]|nr:SGNH/GDSL hydrolase family protein [Actinomycetota bacterium]